MSIIDKLFSVSKQLRLVAFSTIVLTALSSHAQVTDTDKDLFDQILSLQSQMNIKIIGAAFNFF